jgi:toxin ParE1/3/4
MRIRRLPRAIRDVDDIWHWIAAEDMVAAERWVQHIVEATDRLTEFPHSGAPRPELGPGIRSIVVGRYLVLYRVGPDSVDIVRVFHGARELSGLLGGEGDGEAWRPRFCRPPRLEKGAARLALGLLRPGDPVLARGAAGVGGAGPGGAAGALQPAWVRAGRPLLSHAKTQRREEGEVDPGSSPG